MHYRNTAIISRCLLKCAVVEREYVLFYKIFARDPCLLRGKMWPRAFREITKHRVKESFGSRGDDDESWPITFELSPQRAEVSIG